MEQGRCTAAPDPLPSVEEMRLLRAAASLKARRMKKGNAENAPTLPTPDTEDQTRPRPMTAVPMALSSHDIKEAVSSAFWDCITALVQAAPFRTAPGSQNGQQENSTEFEKSTEIRNSLASIINKWRIVKADIFSAGSTMKVSTNENQVAVVRRLLEQCNLKTVADLVSPKGYDSLRQWLSNDSKSAGTRTIAATYFVRFLGHIGTIFGDLSGIQQLITAVETAKSNLMRLIPVETKQRRRRNRKQMPTLAEMHSFYVWLVEKIKVGFFLSHGASAL